jgi:hypothetical protein
MNTRQNPSRSTENGQYVKQGTPVTVTYNINVTSYIYMFIAFIIITPMLYHIFIRKNLMSWIMNVLDSEFGCNACKPCLCPQTVCQKPSENGL